MLRHSSSLLLAIIGHVLEDRDYLMLICEGAGGLLKGEPITIPPIPLPVLQGLHQKRKTEFYTLVPKYIYTHKHT